MTTPYTTIINVGPTVTTLTIQVPPGITAVSTTLTFRFTTLTTTLVVAPPSASSAISSTSASAEGREPRSSFVVNSNTASSTISSATLLGSNITNNRITSSGSKGISAGATAGIGIGCTIAGALVALIACYIYLRRSKKPQNSYPARIIQSNESAYRGHTDIENIKGSQTTSVVALDDIPIDRADDSQIKTSMQDLNELIRQHVENHYNNRPFQGRQSELEAELTRCGYDERSEPPAQTMVALLVAPKTRRIAIRQLIARIILKGTTLESEEETSLLPIYVLAACQAMLGAKRSPGEQQATFTNAFTKWRRLTSFLVSLSSTTHETDPSLQSAITSNVTLLNCVLHPFINADAESQCYQRENLGSIIGEGARFGMVIFSQPNVWLFGWDANRNPHGVARRGIGFVVWPGIGEVVVRGGREHVRVLCEPMIEEV